MSESWIEERYLEIAQQLPGYEPRPIQARMVAAIHDALREERSLVIEAGTGAGKSFGYLIPALLSHHRPIVLSTGTIALQQQLVEKDIPFVAKAAGLDELKVKLVKGRRNYLCIQKLREFEKTLTPDAPERLYVGYLKSAFDAGWDGDREKLDMEIPYSIWEEVMSDTDDCLGKRCQFYQENPYRLAREAIDEADILVVNHALYMMDLNSQAILPPHDVVIFDEAHQLKRYAVNAFTATIGKFATNKLLRKIHRRLQAVPDTYTHLLLQTEAEVMQWLFQHSDQRERFKLYGDERFVQLVSTQVAVLQELQAWLAAFDVSQLGIFETDLEMDIAKVQRGKLLDQLHGLIARWQLFVEGSSLERVNWAEIKPDKLYYELKSTPLNLAEYLRDTLWAKKTGILTSATLASDANLVAFRQDVGLAPALRETPDLILDSPFDFGRQCELYLPPAMPDPNMHDGRFWQAAADEIVQVLMLSRGRAFVLFTSMAAMQRVSAQVIPRIPYPCKMQGDLPKHRLIEWFKTSANSVLFATKTYWEGIDIPGDALSCVIIDKIPFQTPDDPVHSAMVDRLKSLGRNAFNELVLPEATITLKQGFGRLIRTRQDHGLVVILDPRLKTKGYGYKILRSLPPARLIRDLGQATSLLEAPPPPKPEATAPLNVYPG